MKLTQSERHAQLVVRTLITTLALTEFIARLSAITRAGISDVDQQTRLLKDANGVVRMLPALLVTFTVRRSFVIVLVWQNGNLNLVEANIILVGKVARLKDMALLGINLTKKHLLKLAVFARDVLKNLRFLSIINYPSVSFLVLPLLTSRITLLPFVGDAILKSTGDWLLLSPCLTCSTSKGKTA